MRDSKTSSAVYDSVSRSITRWAERAGGTVVDTRVEMSRCAACGTSLNGPNAERERHCRSGDLKTADASTEAVKMVMERADRPRMKSRP